jgi:hypothetical protein
MIGSGLRVPGPKKNRQGTGGFSGIRRLDYIMDNSPATACEHGQ